MTVDDREPAGVLEAVRTHGDVAETSVERLAAGDIVVGSVAVERKTLRDYVSGVMGRSGPDLEDQVERMRQRYAHAYVLLEGNLDDLERLETGIPASALRGSMASITARYGTPVVPCSDRGLLVDYAIRLGRKHLEEPSRRPLPPGSVSSRREPTAKRMYACVDGVGPGTAEALYEAFPTVEALLSATREDLLAVDGVGERRAAAIRDALRSPD